MQQACLPTLSAAIHQHSIDWDALSAGEEGVALQIDSDGDGIFERSIASDSELTPDEFEAAGMPFRIWIVIC